MKITDVDVHPITVPLDNPVVMANQQVDHSRNVVVKVSTDEGFTGWGEGVAAPEVTGDTQSAVVAAARDMGERLIGANPLQHSILWDRMHHVANPASTAVAALDIALHDVAGRALEVPVSALLGDRVRSQVPALRLIGSGQPEKDLDKLQAEYEYGFRWFKLKVAIAEPSREVEALRKAVSLVGSDGVVCADANEGWTGETAIDVLRDLEGSGVRFIEQPTPRDQRANLELLARESTIPLCADESAGGLDTLADMAALGMGGVSLKLIKHGGITGVMRGAAACAELGLEINLAGKIAETSIAAAANLHCAAVIPTLSYGCSPANYGITSDVAVDPPTAVDGHYSVPEGPGLGIEIDERKVKALASQD